jgi:anti-anti-sigma factor
VTRSGRHAIVAVVGEIDMARAPEVRHCLERCRAEGGLDVIIDLSDVTFLGSAGISVLVSVKRTLEQDGGRLALRYPSPVARKVLTLGGLASFFETVGPDPGPTGAHR